MQWAGRLQEGESRSECGYAEYPEDDGCEGDLGCGMWDVGCGIWDWDTEG